MGLKYCRNGVKHYTIRSTGLVKQFSDTENFFQRVVIGPKRSSETVH